MFRSITAALVAFTLATGVASAAPSDTETMPLLVADYTVFVDPPTGFVFVKLPAGWKFAGRLSEQEVARLPSGVVTALLVPQSELMAAKAEATRTR